MTVFLVEDAPLLRERLIALIASVGASTVGHAEGAREAIDGILAAQPDVVVLDLHLKEGSGFDVLRAVPRRLCVVSGVSKLASPRGALAAGLATELVVDEAVARALTE